MLGNKAESLTDIEVKDIVCKLEYLAEGFLDNYEKQIFQGKTLKQVLQND